MRSRDEAAVQSEARRIAQQFRDAVESIGAEVKVVGPAPAPLLKLRQHYRYHFRLQAEKVETLRDLWNHVFPKLKLEGDVELTIDVDPVDMR